MKVHLYGIPSCQSCKRAMSWLRDQGVVYTWVDFREQPPARGKLDEWVAALGAKALRNTSGGAYRALGEEKKSWSEAQWAAAFAADAMLIKRPVLELDGEPKAVGFKPERYAELFAST
mgnify:CR=1 FL=1